MIHYGKFKSRKDNLFALVILATVIHLIFIPVFQYINSGLHPSMVIYVANLAIVVFLAWLWYGTYYIIDDVYIHYRSGPLRGKIAIASIREVQCDTTMWVGYRPALARKGIIIKYNKFDDIYFSPDTNDSFIAALQSVRPNIPVNHS